MAKKRKDMSWRLDLIRECHGRMLAAKAAEIETQQAQAKTFRAAERARKKSKKYIMAILVRQLPAEVVPAVA